MTLKKSAEKVDFWTVPVFSTYMPKNQQYSFLKTQSNFSVQFFISCLIAHQSPFSSPVFQSSFKKWTESGLKSGLTSDPYK